MIRGPKIKVCSNKHINKVFLEMVEKWDPVLGPQDPRNSQDPWEPRDLRNSCDLRDHQDPRIPSTSGFHGTPGTPKTSEPLDLWGLMT